MYTNCKVMKENDTTTGSSTLENTNCKVEKVEKRQNGSQSDRHLKELAYRTNIR